MVWSVEAPDDLEPLPAAVEVAAYRIVVEAVTNAARHSGAQRVHGLAGPGGRRPADPGPGTTVWGWPPVTPRV